MVFISSRPQSTTWPVPVCYWPGHLPSLGQAVVTASVFYPALITLYRCFATLINSVSLSQDCDQCSVLEPNFFAIPVCSYKHAIYMAGEVSLGFFYDFLLVSATVFIISDMLWYKGCFLKHNFLLWREVMTHILVLKMIYHILNKD